MASYRYKFRTGSKKDVCPKCGKKSFVPFLDPYGEFGDNKYGRCDREHKCGYFSYPDIKGKIYDKAINVEPSVRAPFPTHYLGYMKDVSMTSMYRFLCRRYDEQTVKRAFELYRCSSYCYNIDIIVIPYINTRGSVRVAQLMDYDEDTCKRNHNTTYRWLHSSLYNEARKKGKYPRDLIDFCNTEHKVDCLGGEHLVKEYEGASVYIVESFKNALLCTIHNGLPSESNKIFLFSYSRSSLTSKKLSVLAGRQVSFIPDEDSVDYWNEIASSNKYIHTFENDIFFKYTGEGSDIADYYISKS